MGHLINPVSFRVGIVTFWKFNYINFFERSRSTVMFSYDRVIYNFISWLCTWNWFSVFSRRRTRFFLKRKLFLILKLKKQYRLKVFSKIIRQWDVLNFFLLKNFLLLNNNIYKNKLLILYDLFTSRGCFSFRKSNKILPLSFRASVLNRSIESRKIKIRVGRKFKIKLQYRTKFNFVLYNWFIFKIRLLRGYYRFIEKRGRNFFQLRKHWFFEISHYVIYRSGFYDYKVVLYLLNSVHLIVKKVSRRYSRAKRLRGLSSLFLSYYSKFIRFYFLVRKFINFNRFRSLFFRLIYWYKFLFNDLTLKRRYTAIKLTNLFLVPLFFLYKQTKICLFLLKSTKILVYFKFFVKRYSYIKRLIFDFSFLRYRLSIKRKFMSSNFWVVYAKKFYETYIFNFLGRMFSNYLKPLNCVFILHVLSNRVITAKLMFNYFCRNLRTHKPLQRIISMIKYDLNKIEGLIGYKILTSGRFTRKERALYKFIVFKRAPLSTYNSILDYYSGFYKSRFGICGFKLWLFRN